jgi:hypothetical protein
MKLCIGIGLDLKPFICTSDLALSYILSMRCWNHALNPWACNIAGRYECEILSNASLKSMDTMHNGVFVTSAWATASLTLATASKAEFPCRPQCWFGLSIAAKHYLILFAIIRDSIL